MKYRFDGKEKLLALRVYPEVPLKLARTRAEDARRLLADGIDPSDARRAAKAARAERAANSFEVVAQEWTDKQRPAWTPGRCSVTPLRPAGLPSTRLAICEARYARWSRSTMPR